MSDKPSHTPDDAPDGDELPRAAGQDGAEPTQDLGRLSGSPYDAPGASEPPTQPYGAAGGPAYGAAPTAGEIPYGARSTYSRTTYAADEPEPARRRPWLVPLVVVGAIALVGALVYLALTVFGGDEDTGADPAPTETASPEPTESPTETQTPDATATATATATDEPTTEATTGEDPTPAAPASEDLLRQLDESVVAGDTTFTLTQEGFVPHAGIVEVGAIEAYTATFTAGEAQIDFLATSWPSTQEADEYAAAIIENLDGAEQADTGTVYQTGAGTYWAFLLADGSGMYLWTTDRGEVLRVMGPTDWVDGFYTGLSI